MRYVASLLLLLTVLTKIIHGNGKDRMYNKNLRRCEPFISEVQNFDFPDAANRKPGFIELSHHRGCGDLITNYVLVALKTCEMGTDHFFVHGYFNLHSLKWEVKNKEFEFVVLTNDKNEVRKGFTVVEPSREKESEVNTFSGVFTRAAAESKKPNSYNVVPVEPACNPTTLFFLVNVKQGKSRGDRRSAFKKALSHVAGRKNSKIDWKSGTFKPTTEALELLHKNAVDVLVVTTAYDVVGENSLNDEAIRKMVEERLAPLNEIFYQNDVNMASVVVEQRGLEATKSLQRCDQGFASTFTHTSDETPPVSSLWSKFYGISYEYADETAGSENKCKFNEAGSTVKSSWPLPDDLERSNSFLHFYLEEKEVNNGEDYDMDDVENEGEGTEGTDSSQAATEEVIVEIPTTSRRRSYDSLLDNDSPFFDGSEPRPKNARIEETVALEQIIGGLKQELEKGVLEVLKKLEAIGSQQDKLTSISDEIMDKVGKVADKLVLHTTDSAAADSALRLRVEKAAGFNVRSERIATDDLSITYLTRSGLKNDLIGSDPSSSLKELIKEYGNFLKVEYSESDPEKTLVYCGVCTKHHELKNADDCPTRAEGQRTRSANKKKENADKAAKEKSSTTVAPTAQTVLLRPHNNKETRNDLGLSGLCTSDVSNVRSLKRRIQRHAASLVHRERVRNTEATFQTASHMIDGGKNSVDVWTENYGTTVLWILQTNQPMSALPRLGELATKIDAATGYSHFTESSGNEMGKCITSVGREHLRKKMMKDPFHILSDGSTDNGLKQVVVFLVRFYEDRAMSAVTYHLGITELEGSDADSYLTAFDTVLKLYSFDDRSSSKEMWSVMEKNLISMASDAASVMIGDKNGFAKKVEDKLKVLNNNKKIFTAKCRNHMLQNALKELKDTNEVVMVTLLINEIHSFLSSESRTKVRKTLNTVSEELKIPAFIPSRIVGVRWISFMHRSITQLIRSYYALIHTFDTHEQNEDVSEGQQKRAACLKVIMKDPRIFLTVHALKSFLKPVAEVADAMQREGVGIWEADHLLHTLNLRVDADFIEYYTNEKTNVERFGLYCVNELGKSNAKRCTAQQIMSAFAATGPVVSSTNPLFYLTPVTWRPSEESPKEVAITKTSNLKTIQFSILTDLPQLFTAAKSRTYSVPSHNTRASDDAASKIEKKLDMAKLSTMNDHYEKKFLTEKVTPETFLQNMLKLLKDGIRLKYSGQSLENFAVAERLLLVDSLLCPEKTLFNKCPYVLSSLELHERKTTAYSNAVTQVAWDINRESYLEKSVAILQNYYPLRSDFGKSLINFLNKEIPPAVTSYLQKQNSPLPERHFLHSLTSLDSQGSLALIPDKLEKLDYGQLLGLIEKICSSSSITSDNDLEEYLGFLKAVHGVPGSTASVERSFSTVNYFKDGSSTTMSVSVADMRLMSKNFPPAAEFDMSEVRRKWTSMSGRSDSSTGTVHKHITRGSSGPLPRIASIRDYFSTYKNDVCSIFPSNADEDIIVLENDTDDLRCIDPLSSHSENRLEQLSLRKLSASHSLFQPPFSKTFKN